MWAFFPTQGRCVAGVDYAGSGSHTNTHTHKQRAHARTRTRTHSHIQFLGRTVDHELFIVGKLVFRCYPSCLVNVLYCQQVHTSTEIFSPVQVVWVKPEDPAERYTYLAVVFHRCFYCRTKMERSISTSLWCYSPSSNSPRLFVQYFCNTVAARKILEAISSGVS